MAGDEGRVPGGLGFPGDGDVVGALSRADAARAVRAYPVVVRTGPVFAVVEQGSRGRWRVLRTGEFTPQGARDTLGSLLRWEAAQPGTGREAESGRAALLGGARLLDWERRDELTVAGRRFGVARVEEFVRLGPDGPEPPRPTDADAWPPGKGHRGPDPARGSVVAGEIPGSPALLGERWDGLPVQDSVPPQEWADAHWALVTYPKVAVLPARFAVAEVRPSGSLWTLTAAAICPQAARDTLAAYFSRIGPEAAASGDLELAGAYAAGVTLLGRERPHGLTVAGRCFQVIRVEQIMRLCADGPEPPRASDYDPDPPAEAQASGLHSPN